MQKFCKYIYSFFDNSSGNVSILVCLRCVYKVKISLNISSFHIFENEKWLADFSLHTSPILSMLGWFLYLKIIFIIGSVIFSELELLSVYSGILRLVTVLENRDFNLFCSNPGRREKIKLNFYFYTSFWFLKTFYEGLLRSFEAPQRSVKIKT